MRGFLRRVLLGLLLLGMLGLSAFSGGGGGIPAAVTVLADATHHQPSDDDSRQPACMVLRCECHACPHASLLAALALSDPPAPGGDWGRADDARCGAGPDVAVPPPRSANVEAT